MILPKTIKSPFMTMIGRTKTYPDTYRKVLDMKSILSTVSYIPSSPTKESKMTIEYHLQKPSIGIFLWTVILENLRNIPKNKEVFDNTRNEFHKEYVLPIGQSLGYDGVMHTFHFDRDFFTPFMTGEERAIYTSIKGHLSSPNEEHRKAYTSLVRMEERIIAATKTIPALYKQLLYDKKK